MKGLDDGPDGLSDAAFERALRSKSTAATDAVCAKGNATLSDGIWICGGCGRHFAKSPNQHIYAARKRVNALKAVRQ